MVDIFISYSSVDRVLARSLADKLTEYGWSVWWDSRLIVGADFRQIIEANLEAAKCVVVIWSQTSIKSGFVVDEASEGLKKRKLVPVMLENVTPPIGFRNIHTMTLTPLSFSISQADFDELLLHLKDIMGSKNEQSTNLEASHKAVSEKAFVGPQVFKSTNNFLIGGVVSILFIVAFYLLSIQGPSKNPSINTAKPDTNVSILSYGKRKRTSPVISGHLTRLDSFFLKSNKSDGQRKR